MNISELFGHSPCYGKNRVQFLCGNVVDALKSLPDESVHCVATSPPYFRLRDYGHEDQIGMENTPGEFIDALVMVFREVKRVLRSDGTCWINLGDSYAGSGKSGSTEEGRRRHRQFAKIETEARQVGPTRAGNIYPPGYQPMAPGFQPTGTLKGKDLIGTPWMLAFALRDDGWYLRSDIIWAKRSYSPESIKDRCTRSHEHIFMFAKSRQYFYDIDAIRQDSGANARDVWTIGLEQTTEKHYAQFPTEIPRRIIKAGTSQHGCCSVCGSPYIREIIKYRPPTYNASDKDERIREGWGKDGDVPLSGNRPLSSIYRDTQQSKTITKEWQQSCDCDGSLIPATVLDPFAGSCTTGLVATELGRSAVMIDIKDEYLQMGYDRIKNAGFTKALSNIVYI